MSPCCSYHRIKPFGTVKVVGSSYIWQDSPPSHRLGQGLAGRFIMCGESIMCGKVMVSSDVKVLDVHVDAQDSSMQQAGASYQTVPDGEFRLYRGSQGC